jgi:hypothetical protein
MPGPLDIYEMNSPAEVANSLARSHERPLYWRGRKIGFFDPKNARAMCDGVYSVYADSKDNLPPFYFLTTRDDFGQLIPVSVYCQMKNLPIKGISVPGATPGGSVNSTSYPVPIVINQPPATVTQNTVQIDPKLALILGAGVLALLLIRGR